MKKIFIICLFFFLSAVSAQIKRLNDPAIVAQHKRMVFESWGDFRPYPKYVLGVQTNFAYATVWGWLSPARNQDYKNGADIRPLKPTGLEVQRLAELELERREADQIKLQVDSLYNRNLQDLAHWTSATVDADPLWLLYYKKMLTPLNLFPDNPRGYIEWGLKDQKTYDLLLTNGGIEKLKEQLDLLKDQYRNSRTHQMPRGKRFLMYHDTLIGWRNFQKSFRGYQHRVTAFTNFKNQLSNFGSTSVPRNGLDDEIIVKDIMTKYSKKF